MKKGFTLVELLTVIVILGLISLVAYPSIIKIINKSKEDAYNNQKKIIEKVAKEWAIENPTELPDIDNNSCSCNKKNVDIGTLKTKGYLSDEDIKNPKNSDSLNGCVEISCNCNNNSCNTCKYEYQYKEMCTQ